MKTTITIIGVAVLVLIAIGLLPVTRDELKWRFTSSSDKAQDYAEYLAAWPNGRHSTEASHRYDERSWTDAQAGRTLKSYQQYVQIHPSGIHLTEASTQIENLTWQQSTNANTIQSLEAYLRSYDSGRFVTTARTQIENVTWQQSTNANTIRSLNAYVAGYPKGRFLSDAQSRLTVQRTNDAPYLAALQIGTEVTISNFLSEFPGHAKEADAKLALKEITEGRDIVDLLNERKIAVETQGSGIQNVTVRVKRLVPYPITLRIPVGTFFVSASESAQNMVTTAESKASLTSDEWTWISADTACANRPRGVPSNSDKFSVQRSPNQKELEKLMPVLDKAGVSYETLQAAVWIVTDDASYDDLGELVASYNGFGGSRVINEGEAARAMKICAEAGIDITHKRIWSDKQTILSGLKDADTKKWLEEKQ
jgi:hypothetical protein